MTAQLEPHTKIVCICGSLRHFDEMLSFREALMASGASCEWPSRLLKNLQRILGRGNNQSLSSWPSSATAGMTGV